MNPTKCKRLCEVIRQAVQGSGFAWRVGGRASHYIYNPYRSFNEPRNPSNPNSSKTPLTRHAGNRVQVLESRVPGFGCA